MFIDDDERDTFTYFTIALHRRSQTELLYSSRATGDVDFASSSLGGGSGGGGGGAVEQTLLLPDGHAHISLPVSIRADSTPELDEVFAVKLMSVKLAG